MDRRIGYGLSFKEAVEKAIEEIKDSAVHLSFTTIAHEVVWAELRDDGWRVYSGLEAEA